jgi:hypothetical protein
MLHGGKHMVLSIDSRRHCGSLRCDVLDGFDLNCLLTVLRTFACNVETHCVHFRGISNCYRRGIEVSRSFVGSRVLP